MLYFESELLRLKREMGYHTEASRRVVRAKKKMDRQYDEPHSLDSLSRGALVSRFHFARRFRDLYGLSPAQYLTEVRLRESARLLREGKTVLEVCHGVGFNSPTSFSGLFKKRMGVSPSRYRRFIIK